MGYCYNTAETVVDRFWSKVIKTPDCWLWDCEIMKKGYGRFYYSLNKEVTRIVAHKFAWEQEYGLVGEYHLHHDCKNKSCVRPSHLIRLTQEEHHKLEQPNAKLTYRCAEEIRTTFQHRTEGKMKTYERLAAQYGVTPRTIRYCISKYTW